MIPSGQYTYNQYITLNRSNLQRTNTDNCCAETDNPQKKREKISAKLFPDGSDNYNVEYSNGKFLFKGSDIK